MRRRVLSSTQSMDHTNVEVQKQRNIRLTLFLFVFLGIVAVAFMQFFSLHQSGDALASESSKGDNANSLDITDSVAAFFAFRQEVMQSGVRVHDSAHLGEQDSVGLAQRGIITQSDIDRKSTIVELPIACAISAAVARERSAYAKAASLAAEKSGSVVTASMLLAIALAELFARGKFSDENKYGTECDRVVSAYAADLKLHLMHDKGFPQHWRFLDANIRTNQVETGMLTLANDTEVGIFLMQWHQETEVMFRHIEEGIGADIAAKEGLTQELCDLARLGVSSRAFAVPLPASLKPDASFERQPALLPVIDLCNHDLPRPISPLTTGQDVQLHSAFKALAVVKATNESVLLKLTEPSMSGHAISVSYGLHSNAKMLVNYGFTMPWVGALTCLAHVGLALEAPDLPDLMVWPSRCIETDIEMEKALRALRWRQLLAFGVQDLSDFGCVPLLQYKKPLPWQGCRKAASAESELSTWSALKAVIGRTQQRHQNSLLAGKCKQDKRTPTVAIACSNVARILEDELAVLKVLGEISEAVGRECASVTEIEDIYHCIAQVRSNALGAQWADAMFDSLGEGDE